jgi:hypothetical protein
VFEDLAEHDSVEGLSWERKRVGQGHHRAASDSAQTRSRQVHRPHVAVWKGPREQAIAGADVEHPAMESGSKNPIPQQIWAVRAT